MPSLPLLGYTLHFSDTGAPPAGAGAPVVALHSGGLSSRQWTRLSALLGPRHRVLAPDFLGCGGSSPFVEREGSVPYQFSLEVDLVCALLDTVPGPVHLVGHSFGGLITVKTALRQPGRVLSLGLFEPVTMGLLAAGGPEDLAAFEAQMEPLRGPPGEPGGEGWLRAFIDWWQGTGAWDSLPLPAKGQFLAVGRKLFLEVDSLTRDRMAPEELVALGMPVLVLRSEQSPAAERRACELLAQALPRGALRQLDGVGHLAPVTHAATVNALLAEHIEACEAVREAAAR